MAAVTLTPSLVVQCVPCNAEKPGARGATRRVESIGRGYGSEKDIGGHVLRLIGRREMKSQIAVHGGAMGLVPLPTEVLGSTNVNCRLGG